MRETLRVNPVIALALLLSVSGVSIASGSGTLARWTMSPAGSPTDGENPVVNDQAVGNGPNDLWTFNGRGDRYFPSQTTPPASMVRDSTAVGDYAFNAQALSQHDGALFYPQDALGNVFSFSDSFTVELFFKTADSEGDGVDRSNEGFQQLIMQGEQDFRFGLILNEGGPGNIRWALDNDTRVVTVDINARTEKNFANGKWHYLQASYFRQGITSRMSLLTISEDGAKHEVTKSFGAGDAFLLPPDQNDGNLFVGRNDFQLSDSDGKAARNFGGLIDEVRITAGLVGSSDRLGVVPEGSDVRLGDMNGDGEVNNLDINPFVLALTDPQAYEAEYGMEPVTAGDINGDGQFNNLDINPFVDRLTDGS